MKRVILVFDWNTGCISPRVVNDPASYKHCRIAAYTDTGHVRFEEFGNWEITSLKLSEYPVFPTTPETWRIHNDRAQIGLTNAMFDWLEDDTRPVGTNLKRALHQFNAVLGIYASAIFHKPIDLPFDPPTDLDLQLREILLHP